MSIEFATAAALQQTGCNRRLTRAFVPVAKTQPVVSSDTPREKFTFCMEFAFGSVVLIGALLFAAALLRFGWIDGQAAAGLRAAARIVYAAAGATGTAALYSLGLGIYYLACR